MRILQNPSKRRVKLTLKQKLYIQSLPAGIRRRKAKSLKKEIKARKLNCYQRKKLESQGLYRKENDKNTLKVIRVPKGTGLTAKLD